ncbi:chromobox protein homolog 5-like [Bradysia coprophila]|uniref:chromobox protein homolog 5-like n=1 Tax=Bradysia coprophila TaxID=38358 RepID=UPI00187DB794|nr:chromobox protein homolog 5-like [Bradysia coprophila]
MTTTTSEAHHSVNHHHSSGTDGETSKTVEQVIDRRLVNGAVEYYIKWKGFSSEYNTWENEHNLDDAVELMLQFDQDKANILRSKLECNSSEHDESSDDSFDSVVKRYKLQKERETVTEQGTANSCSEDGEEEKKAMGFCKFLMKWKDSEESDLVPVEQANIRCAEIVIQFYEARFPWNVTESTEKEEKFNRPPTTT